MILFSHREQANSATTGKRDPVEKGPYQEAPTKVGITVFVETAKCSPATSAGRASPQEAVPPPPHDSGAYFSDVLGEAPPGGA